MHPFARVLSRLTWLVWACLLVVASATGGAAPSVTTGIYSGGERHHAIASRDLGDTLDAGATLTRVTRHIHDNPATDAETLDPALCPRGSRPPPVSF
jgi:hypothetical protein